MPTILWLSNFLISRSQAVHKKHTRTYNSTYKLLAQSAGLGGSKKKEHSVGNDCISPIPALLTLACCISVNNNLLLTSGLWTKRCMNIFWSTDTEWCMILIFCVCHQHVPYRFTYFPPVSSHEGSCDQSFKVMILKNRGENRTGKLPAPNLSNCVKSILIRILRPRVMIGDTLWLLLILYS